MSEHHCELPQVSDTFVFVTTKTARVNEGRELTIMLSARSFFSPPQSCHIVNSSLFDLNLLADTESHP